MKNEELNPNEAPKGCVAVQVEGTPINSNLGYCEFCALARLEALCDISPCTAARRKDGCSVVFKVKEA